MRFDSDTECVLLKYDIKYKFDSINIMIPYNNLVHYIWVGTSSIPEEFLSNYKNTMKLNPTYEFKMWRDEDVIENDPEYTELYKKSKIFHKLQIARYTILHKFGGVYTDFDIQWKIKFDEVYDMFDDMNIILPQRNSLHFYNRGMKTTLLDDFTIFAKAGILKQYLYFCNKRNEVRDNETEPFSVYALTEWALTQNNIGFLTPKQIDVGDGCTVGIHANGKTWKNIF